jgi:hypothetical protein
VAAVLDAVVSSRAVNQPSSPEQAAALQSRSVGHSTHRGLQTGRVHDYAADQADLSGAAVMQTKVASRFVRDTLEQSQATQKSILMARRASA